MKKLFYLFLFISLFGYSQTQITDANFQEAINTCLTTNPVDGLCSDNEYGAMPDWDVSDVKDMSNAFEDKSNFNGDISSWDVSSVTNMYRMFGDAKRFNGDISAWDVSSVTDMYVMFRKAQDFNQDISTWDVSSVTNMSYMFSFAQDFNQDISTWDVSSVTNMRDMFYSAQAFNGDISAWDVSSVTNMSYMFSSAQDFNQDISTWDVSSVTNMRDMFYSAQAFNGDISAWDVSSVTDMGGMFYGATSYNGDISAWDVSSVTDMNYMFDNSGLSKGNYDKLLNGWSQQNLKSNVSFSAFGINYCNGASGRQKLIDDFGWIITDGGLDCATASIEDQNQLDISIYPNPTNDKLFIQGLSSSSRVSIYNVLGKLVLSQTISKEIDVKQLSKGIYMLKIVDEQKEIVRKFIKN
jgi:surface protein